MKKSDHITAKLAIRFITVILLYASLSLLTGANFFLFTENKNNPISVLTRDTDDKEAPQEPVDQKSTENKNITSLQEEYLHEHSARELVCFDNVSLHKIHSAEKLEIIYFEILLPPPKI